MQESEKTLAPGRKRLAHAFTLVEVLVSVVVLATGIVLVLRAFETSLRTLSKTRADLLASVLVQAKLSEVSAQSRVSGNIGALDNSGSFAPPLNDFLWRCDYEDTGLEGVGPNRTNSLVRATVAVGRADAPEAGSASTYLRVHP